jgi:hypothetical protein
MEREPKFNDEQLEQLFLNMQIFESEFPEDYIKILKTMYQTGFEDLHLMYLDWKDGQQTEEIQ